MLLNFAANFLCAAVGAWAAWFIMREKARQRSSSIAEWMEKEVSTSGTLFAGQPTNIAHDFGRVRIFNDSDATVEYWLRIRRDPDAAARRKAYAAAARRTDVH